MVGLQFGTVWSAWMAWPKTDGGREASALCAATLLTDARRAARSARRWRPSRIFTFSLTKARERSFLNRRLLTALGLIEFGNVGACSRTPSAWRVSIVRTHFSHLPQLYVWSGFL
jgi:hypothetical protein